MLIPGTTPIFSQLASYIKFPSVYISQGKRDFVQHLSPKMRTVFLSSRVVQPFSSPAIPVHGTMGSLREGEGLPARARISPAGAIKRGGERARAASLCALCRRGTPKVCGSVGVCVPNRGAAALARTRTATYEREREKDPEARGTERLRLTMLGAHLLHL